MDNSMAAVIKNFKKYVSNFRFFAVRGKIQTGSGNKMQVKTVFCRTV
jgi:hypothetical protein